MIYKYEMACMEAGLSEEQIQEIRRFFDREKKRLKRETAAREKCGYTFRSIHEFVPPRIGYEGDWKLDTYDIPNHDYDIEEECIHKMDLEKLNQLMHELPAEDREFLYACFEDPDVSDVRLAKLLGIPRTTLQSRRERLLKNLRKRFENS